LPDHAIENATKGETTSDRATMTISEGIRLPKRDVDTDLGPRRRPCARWIDPFTEPAAVRAVWEALAEPAKASYFLSWPWVENWLGSLPPTARLQLLVMMQGETPVAAGFLGRRTMLRNRVVPSRALILNGTGWPEFDEICVEHNAWLASGPLGLRDVLDALPQVWDELLLDALDAIPDAESVADAWPIRLKIRERRPCYLVDLEKVRSARDADYLSLLAGDLRSQIKRSYKLYQARGPIALEVATEPEHARDIFSELVALHQTTWKKRGEPGAFATPYFLRFHQRLIEGRIPHGEIQLMRIRAGTSTIGCLYNFVWHGTVSFYQSGVAYESDNRLKPGLLCHVEAIRHNAGAGHRLYDFLAGDARYKRGLSTDVREMVWATVQRPRLRFLAEDFARIVVAAVRQHRADGTSAASSAGREVQGQKSPAPAPRPRTGEDAAA
jgi:CelD/BcsL family acetyltransferase involved in cellulose biosynthesis